ncbi:MAG: TIGR04053 family radical SAM/SPASM domain-containing protein [SAR202 cluster bacterium]|nr:TIGR04053 family radical SAM/SPASM domain-containing protein [SAR202 cluster bacterium]MDP6800948.1 TIGR04053 family radical SAM/SPASM domain-containing protein [SAR202 cluster bacterium]
MISTHSRGHARGGPPMVDMDRDPVVVFWEVTQACALACIHCRAEAQPKRHPLELTDEESMKVLEDLTRFDHMPIVVLSGGDPFMHPNLFKFVERGIELGLTMSVSPAATALLTRQRLQRLVDLGVSRISLSLDGSTAEAHDAFRRVDGSFERTLQGMADARDVGLEFQVNTTVTRQTVDDLPAVADLLVASGAVLWDVFMLVPTGRGQTDDVISAEEHERVFGWLYDLSGTVPYMVKTTLGQHYRRVQVLKRLVAEGKSDVELTPELVKSMYRGLPTNDGRGILFISHLGEVFPSGFLPVTAGNVRKESIVELYRNGDVFRTLRTPSQLKGKCGQCPFNEICGGCRARAYGATGDYLEPESFCVFQPPEAKSHATETARVTGS